MSIEDFAGQTQLADTSLKKALDVVGDKAVAAAEEGINRFMGALTGLADKVGDKVADIKERAVGAMQSKMESVTASVTPTQSPKANDTPVVQSSIDNLPSHVKEQSVAAAKSMNQPVAAKQVDNNVRVAEVDLEHAHSAAPMSTPAMGYGGRSAGYGIG